ncbi:hypothetical protein C0J52_18780 [Blattella germanica]|nr:hypothetical protein C0J52_18780 [Blattella germanica]
MQKTAETPTELSGENQLDDLKYFVPGNGLISRFRRRVRKSCLISDTHPQALAIYKSPAGISNERIKHLARYYYMIHPFSDFRLRWDLIMIVVLTWSLLVIPFHLAFNLDESTHESGMYVYIMLVLDIFCLIDIVITFLTGYYKIENKEICLDFWFVARMYIRNLFVIDLISSLPIDFLMSESITDKELSITRFYAQLMTLVKVFRIKSLFIYINSWMSARKNWDQSWIKVFRAMFLLVLYIHWMTCLTYLVPLVTDFGTRPAERGTWLAVRQVWTFDRTMAYVTCMYRSMSMLFCISFGSVPPLNMPNMIFAIVNTISGFVIMVVIIALIDQLTRLVNTAEVKYEEKVVQLKEYMNHKKMPGDLQTRILDYYLFRYQGTYFKEAELLNTMTKQLKQDVMLHSCRRLVENVTFFNNLPTELLVRIVTCLHSEIYLTNDVIVKGGTHGDSMFFISTGTVAVYTPVGIEVCHLEDGAHFGEIALVIEGYTRIASVVAVEPCEVFRLDRVDFLRVVSPYPDLLSKVEQIAADRREKTMQLDDEYRHMNVSRHKSVSSENSAVSGVSGTRKSKKSQISAEKAKSISSHKSKSFASGRARLENSRGKTYSIRSNINERKSRKSK